MATDYLSALKEYSAGGGKSIEDFLAQHTTAPKLPPGVVTPALTPSQPSDVAARLAAADARDRLGLGTAPEGNVITKNALRPVSAESDKLAATIAARNTPGGVVVQPAYAAAPTAGVFSPTPRRIAPAFDTTAAAAPASADTAKPWWQKSSFDSGFQNFIDANAQNADSQAAGRAQRDNSFVRINKNTYLPASQNYNSGSSL